MSDLKACPFCGRIPDIEDCGTNRYFIRCKCGIAQDKLYAQKCDAVRAWNKRKDLRVKDTNVPITDTISRQAAIDALCDNCDNVKAVCAHYPCKQYIAIEQLPSAEPKTCAYWDRESNFCTLHRPSAQPSYSCSHEKDAHPRMKGRWEIDSYGAMDDGEYLMTRCSVCGTAYEYGHDDRYCGFCGAEMSEGDEDENIPEGTL